jgi:hypothetical protein
VDGDGDENDRLETGEKTSLGAVYLLASRDCQSLQFPGSFRGALEPHFFWVVDCRGNFPEAASAGGGFSKDGKLLRANNI